MTFINGLSFRSLEERPPKTRDIRAGCQQILNPFRTAHRLDTLLLEVPVRAIFPFDNIYGRWLWKRAFFILDSNSLTLVMCFTCSHQKLTINCFSRVSHFPGSDQIVCAYLCPEWHIVQRRSSNSRHSSILTLVPQKCLERFTSGNQISKWH